MASENPSQAFWQRRLAYFRTHGRHDAHAKTPTVRSTFMMEAEADGADPSAATAFRDRLCGDMLNVTTDMLPVTHVGSVVDPTTSTAFDILQLSEPVHNTLMRKATVADAVDFIPATYSDLTRRHVVVRRLYDGAPNHVRAVLCARNRTLVLVPQPLSVSGGDTQTETMTIPVYTLRLTHTKTDDGALEALPGNDPDDDPNDDDDDGDDDDDDNDERLLRLFWLNKLGLKASTSAAVLEKAVIKDGGDVEDLLCRPSLVLLVVQPDDVDWVVTPKKSQKGDLVTSYVVTHETAAAIQARLATVLDSISCGVDTDAVFNMMPWKGEEFPSLPVLGRQSRKVGNLFLTLCGTCGTLVWLTIKQLLRKMGGQAALDEFDSRIKAAAEASLKTNRPAAPFTGVSYTLGGFEGNDRDVRTARRKLETLLARSVRAHKGSIVDALEERSERKWNAKPQRLGDHLKTAAEKDALMRKNMKRLGFNKVAEYREYLKRLGKKHKMSQKIKKVERVRSKGVLSGKSAKSPEELRQLRLKALGESGLTREERKRKRQQSKAPAVAEAELKREVEAALKVSKTPSREALERERARICGALQDITSSPAVSKRARAALGRLGRELRHKPLGSASWMDTCLQLRDLIALR